MKYNSIKREGCDYSTPAVYLIRDAISEKAMTKGELAEAIQRTPQTVGNIVNRIRDELFIESWEVGRGPHKPRYKLGNSEDAPKPERMTTAEKVKRYRESPRGKKVCRKCRIRWRRSASGRDYERRRNKNKTAINIFETKGVSGIDPLLAAIMVM